MGLFTDVEGMGFGKVDMKNVFQDETKHASQVETKEASKAVEKQEEDVLFDKSYQCPICDHNFKVKAIRTGKLKLIEQDEEMRPIYENHIDPLKYDAITCPQCGYSALTKFYKPVTSGQLRMIKQEYCSNFKGIQEESPCMSYQGALLRHKLSLVCALKRNAKSSEKAYIFLKMAWLIRGALEENAVENSEREEMIKEESECILKAYEGFQLAFSKEPFPMCGMDEISLRYIMAVLAHKLGKREECVRMLAGVLTSKAAPQRIKDKAYDLKETIKQEVIDEKQ